MERDVKFGERGVQVRESGLPRGDRAGKGGSATPFSITSTRR